VAERADEAEVAALGRAGLHVVPVDSHRGGAEETLTPRCRLVGNPAKVEPVGRADAM
jgi:hypothetical protein